MRRYAILLTALTLTGCSTKAGTGALVGAGGGAVIGGALGGVLSIVIYIASKRFLV